MTPNSGSLIWATRGRTWGFRFLRDGGLTDPLPAYEVAFAGAENERSLYRRVGGTVAVRFPDPDGRSDFAGRTITHEFVLFPPLSDSVNSLEDAVRLFQGSFATEYANAWAAP